MLRFAWLAMAGLLWIAPAIARTAFTPRDESPQDFPADFYICGPDNKRQKATRALHRMAFARLRP
jgi:hypothetical protein